MQQAGINPLGQTLPLVVDGFRCEESAPDKKRHAQVMARPFQFLLPNQVCLSLLQAGADKQLFDKGGLTPLHLAECKRRDRIAAVLRNWRPIGLTATQIQGIIDSRVDGDPRYAKSRCSHNTTLLG